MDTGLRIHAEFYKALGHPMRLLLVEALVAGERPFDELLTISGAKQAQLSQQLAVLRHAGLVTSRRTGIHVTYGLTDGRLADLLRDAHNIQLGRATSIRKQLESSPGQSLR